MKGFEGKEVDGKNTAKAKLDMKNIACSKFKTYVARGKANEDFKKYVKGGSRETSE